MREADIVVQEDSAKRTRLFRWHGFRRKEAAAAQKQQGAKSAPDEEGEPRDAQAPTALGSLTTMLRSWHIWYLGCIWAIVSVGMDGLIFWIPLLIK